MAALGRSRSITHFCIGSCRKALAQIGRVKSALLAEWRDRLEDDEGLLRLALNEAEALAWQTSYPHLVFPDLALERVQGTLDWVRHQHRVCRAEFLPALAGTPAGSAA